MNLLREYIRELLTEAAMGPADLPDGVYVRVENRGKYLRVFYSYKDGEQIGTGVGNETVSGYVEAKSPDAREKGRATPDREPCLGAWMVIGAGATHGWGPLLYDVVMEVVGAAGLMADRQSLSKAAFNVWNMYMSRGDVVKKQLDDTENTLTPGEEDNCDIDTAIHHSGLKVADVFNSDWSDEDGADLLLGSPVMKVYTKEPTTIQKLKVIGRFIGE